MAALLIGFVCLTLATTIHATDVVKANNADALNLATSWGVGGPPTPSDVGVWDNTVAAANTTVLGADSSWAGIRVADPGGLVTINAGNTLTLGTSGIDMSSAALQNLMLNNAVTIGGAQSWNIASGRTNFVGGAVAINNALSKDGLGTVVLSVANTGAGGLTINNGRVNLGVATAAGTGGIVLNGGTLGVGGFAIANAINVAGPATFLGTTGNAQNNGTLTGGSILTVFPSAAGSTWTLNGGMSGFTGTVLVGSGAVGFVRLGSGTSGSASATFNLGNDNIIFHSQNGGTFNMGALQGGFGTQLQGPRSANGTATYSVGALASSTFNGTITNGNSASRITALTKVGSGTTLTLGGTNRYTGATLVSAGTLRVDGVLAGAGAVTVDAAGKLMGNGGINGATTVNGELAPGGSIGTMTFSNALTLAGLTTMELDRDNTQNSDHVNVGGLLTYGGTLTVNNIGLALQSGDTFDLFDWASQTDFFLTSNLPGLDPGLTWDTSLLNTSGIISVIPEPATIALIGIGGLAALIIRRRRKV